MLSIQCSQTTGVSQKLIVFVSTLQRTQNVVKNGIQNLIFQSEMGNATTPMAGSVVPVAPQVYYHQPVQPPHIPNTSGDHNTGTLHEAMHDAVNMNW